MKAFQFSLESVLEYRREIETEWEIKLGAAVGKCNRLEGLITHLHQEEQSALNSRDIHNSHEALAWGMYRSRLRQQKEKREIELEKATSSMEVVRQGYLEASRDRKSLDKLKDKKKDEYHRYLIQQEIQQMDELNAHRAHREVV
ncbi:MAG: flagellar export protein FliJ [Spirochaetaceae bacterium]|jgi:flagellar FliJ protein|nr:flagellar export protein FliJ [Spirochaetaceae bacterium]